MKGGTDIFDMYLSEIHSSYKSFKPWMPQYLWLWEGCIVNAHLYWKVLFPECNRTLIDSVVVLLDELDAKAAKEEKKGRSKKLKKDNKRLRERIDVCNPCVNSTNCMEHEHVGMGKQRPCAKCGRRVWMGCKACSVWICSKLHSSDTPTSCWAHVHKSYSAQHLIVAKAAKRRITIP